MAAPYLFWQSYLFESAEALSVDELKIATLDKMREIGLANAAIQGSDVYESTSDTIVAVCYVGFSSQKWVAIVMAAGTHAKSLLGQLKKKFDSVNWF